VLLGKTGDASKNYQVRFDQQNDNGQVVETDTYSAAGLIENGSFSDRVESRIRKLALSYEQTTGANTDSFLATLGTDATPLKLVRFGDGRQTIEGPVDFSSSKAACNGGEITVATPTPLSGDAGFTEGVLTLTSGGTTARLQFNANGDVDVTIGNGPAERVSGAEFISALNNQGC
jgi:hypothetical protein